jgi:small subunit ribosomal protein S18
MSRPFVRSRRKKVSKLTRSGVEYVDYKDVELLKQFIDTRGKILPRRITGNSARHQRMITEAIKRARYVALVPYVIE